MVGSSHSGASLPTASLSTPTHSASTEPPLRAWIPAPIIEPLRTARRTIIILSLVLAGCSPTVTSQPTPEITTLKILADRATSPLLIDLAKAYHPPHGLITWNLQVGESGTVIDWLKTGAAPYALLDYSPEMFNAVAPSLWITPAAQEGIAIIVNSANTITNLTAAQLRSILQGRVDNWQSVGGPNLPLTLVARPDASSETALIQRIVLGERRLTRAARLATTASAAIDIVASTPGAIGYTAIGYLTPAVKALALEGVPLTLEGVANGQYPLNAPIVFAGLTEPPEGPYRDFFAWVQSPEGQAIVRQRYGGIATPVR